MIEIIATAESVEQAHSLFDAGVDAVYVGEDQYGLRMPASLAKEEIAEIAKLAHEKNKRVIAAVNAIMHNDRIEAIAPYLEFLQSIGVHAITVGDAGVIHLLRKNELSLPFIYDAQTMVTSANQINFWVKRGAIGAVAARELTYEELKAVQEKVPVPIEVQVYGATCIYQSKRPLVENYFRFTDQKKPTSKEQNLFLSEYKNADKQYSIFEDVNGTHIFAAEDLNLMQHLDMLIEANITQWKLDGIFTKGEPFVKIASLFVEAKRAIMEGRWSKEACEKLNEQLIAYHPEDRTLGTGFFLKSPSEIK